MCFVYSQYKKYIFNCKSTFGLGSDLWTTCLHLQVCVYVWCCVTVKMGIASSMASIRKLPNNKKQWKKHVCKNDNWECICTGCGVAERTLLCPYFLNCFGKNLHQQDRKVKSTLKHITKNETRNISIYLLHGASLKHSEKKQCKVCNSVGFSGKTKQGKDEKDTG